MFQSPVVNLFIKNFNVIKIYILPAQCIHMFSMDFRKSAIIRVCNMNRLVCTVCPTRYQTRYFFNNSNTIKILQEYVRCVRNEKECVCSVCL